ncbi:MAG: hypothetical protein UHG12_11865 [Methanobrevibacter sp.]|nr:hypothetical protein [Methanobrevibacter sp.]
MKLPIAIEHAKNPKDVETAITAKFKMNTLITEVILNSTLESRTLE